VINFGSGPAQLPLDVLLEAQKDFLNFSNTGMSLVELSHRSSTFEKVLTEAELDLRKILDIPPNYKVIFLQGGGMGQFAAVPLNLLTSESANPQDLIVDYLVTGRWSERAAQEAQMYCTVNQVCNSLVNDKVTCITPKDQWKASPNAIYRYYCDNETIHGVEFPVLPELGDSSTSSELLPPPAPLVCDMSSNFLSRRVDVSKYGLIFAGAQKNCGISGIVIVIVREDLFKKKKKYPVPSILDYKVNSDGKSLVNTPPTFAIYMAGLMFKWILKQGGVQEMERISQIKSKLLYDYIDNSNGFYKTAVSPGSRSRMNVCFSLGTATLEESFLKEAKGLGMVGLAGHRSVGGCRAALFNSITVAQVEKLVKFMTDFQTKNSQ